MKPKNLESVIKENQKELKIKIGSQWRNEIIKFNKDLLMIEFRNFAHQVAKATLRYCVGENIKGVRYDKGSNSQYFKEGYNQRGTAIKKKEKLWLK